MDVPIKLFNHKYLLVTAAKNSPQSFTRGAAVKTISD